MAEGKQHTLTLIIEAINRAEGTIRGVEAQVRGVTNTVSQTGASMEAATQKITQQINSVGTAMQTGVSNIANGLNPLEGLFNTLNASVSSLQGRLAMMGGAFGALAAAVPIVAALGAAASFLQKSLHDASVETQNMIQLQSVWKGLGRGSEQEMKSMVNTVKDMSRATSMPSQEVVEGMKMLAGFRNIANENLVPALKVAVDFAAFSGRSMREAAYVVGYAARGELQMLREWGFTFSEATQKSKNFNDILREMGARVGGQEAAKMQTYEGAVGGLSKSFNRLEKAVGHVIEKAAIPVIKDLMDYFTGAAKGVESAFEGGQTDVWVQKVQTALQGVADWTKRAFTGIMEFASSGGLERLINAFMFLVERMQGMALWAGKIFGFLATLPSAFYTVTGAAIGFAIVIKIVQAIIGVFTGLYAKIWQGLGIIGGYVARVIPGLKAEETAAYATARAYQARNAAAAGQPIPGMGVAGGVGKAPAPAPSGTGKPIPGIGVAGGVGTAPAIVDTAATVATAAAGTGMLGKLGGIVGRAIKPIGVLAMLAAALGPTIASLFSGGGGTGTPPSEEPKPGEEGKPGVPAVAEETTSWLGTISKGLAAASIAAWLLPEPISKVVAVVTTLGAVITGVIDMLISWKSGKDKESEAKKKEEDKKKLEGLGLSGTKEQAAAALESAGKAGTGRSSVHQLSVGDAYAMAGIPIKQLEDDWKKKFGEDLPEVARNGFVRTGKAIKDALDPAQTDATINKWRDKFRTASILGESSTALRAKAIQDAQSKQTPFRPIVGATPFSTALNFVFRKAEQDKLRKQQEAEIANINKGYDLAHQERKDRDASFKKDWEWMMGYKPSGGASVIDWKDEMEKAKRFFAELRILQDAAHESDRTQIWATAQSREEAERAIKDYNRRASADRIGLVEKEYLAEKRVRDQKLADDLKKVSGTPEQIKEDTNKIQKENAKEEAEALLKYEQEMYKLIADMNKQLQDLYKQRMDLVQRMGDASRDAILALDQVAAKSRTEWQNLQERVKQAASETQRAIDLLPEQPDKAMEIAKAARSQWTQLAQDIIGVKKEIENTADWYRSFYREAYKKETKMTRSEAFTYDMEEVQRLRQEAEGALAAGDTKRAEERIKQARELDAQLYRQGPADRREEAKTEMGRIEGAEKRIQAATLKNAEDTNAKVSENIGKLNEIIETGLQQALQRNTQAIEDLTNAVRGTEAKAKEVKAGASASAREAGKTGSEVPGVPSNQVFAGKGPEGTGEFASPLGIIGDIGSALAKTFSDLRAGVMKEFPVLAEMAAGESGRPRPAPGEKTEEGATYEPPEEWSTTIERFMQNFQEKMREKLENASLRAADFTDQMASSLRDNMESVTASLSGGQKGPAPAEDSQAFASAVEMFQGIVQDAAKAFGQPVGVQIKVDSSGAITTNLTGGGAYDTGL